jgi:hypothetical protein
LTHAGYICAEHAYRHVSRRIRETDFLCYDPKYLADCYKDEVGVIGTHLPYIELERLLGDTWTDFLVAAKSLQVAKAATPFDLAKSPPPELSDFQAQALAQFKREGKVDRDDLVLRLQDYDSQGKTLRVQRCNYSDGLRSNYAMDLRGHIKLGAADVSLRAILQAQYGRRVPPLSDGRLSNAVGIAVVLFYKTEQGEILPYLPRRTKPGILSETIGITKKQAVFSGGYHCTASGEAMWKDAASSFEEVFTQDMCRELYEEVGLTEQDLAWIYPVSFCRELLRGGKPQLFFAGFTKLPPPELNARRRDAIQRQIGLGRQEIEDEVLIADTAERLYAELWSHGTIEAVANMAFAQDCAILAHKAKQFR